MTPHRLRILLADEPGRLGRAALALSELGVNILDVDVQRADGTRWTDDLLVELAADVDRDAVAAALDLVGVELLDLRPADSHDLVDGVTRALDVAHSLMSGAAPDDDRILVAVGQLTRVELAWITPNRLLALHGVTAEAMITGSPHQHREWSKSLHAGDGPVWALAVPFDHGDHRRVVTVLRTAPRFTFSETARLQALLRVAAARPRPRRQLRPPRPLVPAPG